MLNNDATAISDAKKALDGVFTKYVNGESCQVGFALISSRSSELGQGVELSDAIAGLIQSDFATILPKDASGGTGRLISESIALPGTTPVGEVQLQLFLNTGCKPAWIDGAQERQHFNDIWHVFYVYHFVVYAILKGQSSLAHIGDAKARQATTVQW